jgi:hypothetical protein
MKVLTHTVPVRTPRATVMQVSMSFDHTPADKP